MLAALSGSALVPAIRQRRPQGTYTQFTVNSVLTRVPVWNLASSKPQTLAGTTAAACVLGSTVPGVAPRIYVGSPNGIYGYFEPAATSLSMIFSTGIGSSAQGTISVKSSSVDFYTAGGGTWFSMSATTGFRLEYSNASTLCQGGMRGGTGMSLTAFGGDNTGTNAASGKLYLAPGRSTGSAAPASVVIQGTLAGSSGSTVQTLFDILTVSGPSPNVTIAAGAATHVPLAVKGAASQSGNLTEWRDSANALQLAVDSSGRNLILDTTTGSKIGTAVSQKLGFWGVTPVVQPAAASQGALTDDTSGTAGTIISNVGPTYSQTVLNNNFATLLALVSSMRTALVNSGIMKGGA